MADIYIIHSRWQNGAKLAGLSNVIKLADGGIISGCYFLTECGTVTPSHDALSGFTLSEGFPTDANGNSVNDRDYYGDKDAQRITMDIARNYDSRAIQTPVIVSPDGVVLSGNGRTMAGELAARDNTDGAYIDYLKKYGSVYGFNAGQVSNFSHPRLVFVIDNELPYIPATFARFNAQETKGQSKTEQAIKFGKLIDDETFNRILSVLNSFDTLSDFYACTEAATKCINELRSIGVVDSMQYASMFDGDTISSTGKEVLENVLIGKAFVSDPDAARKITTYKSLRKSVVFGLSEVANNLCLGDDYTLKNELSEAVNLAFVARSHGYKSGKRVSDYARQIDAFTNATVCDYRNKAVLVLADVMNGEQVSLLKRILSVYNHQAKDSSEGQLDMFCEGGIKTKAEILEDVKTIFAKGTAKEQNEAVTDSIKARTTQNIFVTEEQSTTIAKGGYVEYMTLSGEAIVCKAERIKGMIVYLSAKGGVNLTANINDLKPTANHLLELPTWLKVGAILTDGKRSSQRVQNICDNTVCFEWIDGGVIYVNTETVIKDWKPSNYGICIFEAA